MTYDLSKRPMVLLDALASVAKRWAEEDPIVSYDDPATWEQFADDARSFLGYYLEKVANDRQEAPKGSQNRAWVYYLYSESGRLIYIGITSNPQARFGQHRRRFGDALHRWHLMEVESYEAALAWEAQEIERLHPAFNVDHPVRAVF